MKKYLLIILCFLSINLKAHERIIIKEGYTPLFIYFGQSNLGRSRASEMTTSDSVLYYGTKSGLIWNWAYSSYTIEELNIGVNTRLRNPSYTDEFGAMEVATTLLSDWFGHDFLLFKIGYGNTYMEYDALKAWEINATPQYSYYEENLKVELANVCQLAKTMGYNLQLILIHGYQGENDATVESYADNWFYNITNLYADFRVYWTDLSLAYFSDVKVINYIEGLDRINAGSDASEVYDETIKQAQVDYIGATYGLNEYYDNTWFNAIDNKVLFSNGDTIGDGIRTHKDYVHLDAASNCRKGEEYFKFIRNIITFE